MRNRIVFFLVGAACACLVTLGYVPFLRADGYVPPPQKLARSLTVEQSDREIAKAPSDRNVGIPAWYAKQAAAYRPVATNALAPAVPALEAIIRDTRANIPEVAPLSDIEIAALYLAQMAKNADALAAAAPTNTLEFLIGAGMREDIKAAARRKSAE